MALHRVGAVSQRRVRLLEPQPDTCRHVWRSRFFGPGGMGLAVCARISAPRGRLLLNRMSTSFLTLERTRRRRTQNMRDYEIVLAWIITFMMEDLEHVSGGASAGLPVGNGATLEEVGCSAPRHGSGGE